MFFLSAVSIFIFFLFSWVLRNFFIDYNEFFYWPYAFYYLMALYGGIVGLYISTKWGGWKTAVGRSIIIFSLALLGQVFGQVYYSIMFEFIGNETPYPIGEIGFLSSVVLYAFGAFSLAKIAGGKISINGVFNKIALITIPVVLYLFAYLLFIREVELDFTVITFDSVTAILSIIYPLVHATFISVTLLAYLLSRKVLGGQLKTTILFLLIALFVHYFAESFYLYQNRHGLYEAGGTSDLGFLIAYFTMTMGLIQFNSVLNKLKGKSSQTNNSTQQPEVTVQ